MEREKLNLFRWTMAFERGMYDDPDVKVQILAGWYDWFCKDSSLAAKTKKLGNIIKGIHYGGKVRVHECYVWFKNNCPLNGPLYDDFRIANISDGVVQFTTQVNCCWNKHKYSVYGRTPDGVFYADKPLFETDSLKELKAWFNRPWTDEDIKRAFEEE